MTARIRFFSIHLLFVWVVLALLWEPAESASRRLRKRGFVEESDGNEFGRVFKLFTDDRFNEGQQPGTNTIKMHRKTASHLVVELKSENNEDMVDLDKKLSQFALTERMLQYMKSMSMSMKTGSPTPIPITSRSLPPSLEPTPAPTNQPTEVPTPQPTVYLAPTARPTQSPTTQQTVYLAPTGRPTQAPTTQPIEYLAPTARPTQAPTTQPAVYLAPTAQPTQAPTLEPTIYLAPTALPSPAPTPLPSIEVLQTPYPTAAPTPPSTVYNDSTPAPTKVPTVPQTPAPSVPYENAETYPPVPLPASSPPADFHYPSTPPETDGSVAEGGSEDRILSVQEKVGVCSGPSNGVGCASESQEVQGGNPNDIVNCFDVTSVGLTAPFQLTAVRFWVGDSSLPPADLSIQVWEGFIASGPTNNLYSQLLTGYVPGENTAQLSATLLIFEVEFCVGVKSESLTGGLRVQTDGGSSDRASYLMSPRCGLPEFKALGDIAGPGDFCIEAFVKEAS